MENTTFYSKLLGIRDPWYVTDVSLDEDRGRVDVWVSHRDGVRFPCPECECFAGIYDHTTEREFRHLNTCQMETWLHVRIPRVKCKEHGVQQITHGLADKNSTMTYEFERLAIELQHECSLESVSRLLRLEWHRCQQIQERAVLRGFERKPQKIPRLIGVDEKSFAKGHEYETLVYNIEDSTVEYVSDHRGQESLEAYYKRFSPQQRAQVESVAMDMWDPYIAATKAYIPDAEKKIVFDRFHIMKHVVDAVDKVRKAEHAALRETGKDLLKGTKYLWLWSQENIPPWRREEFETLRECDLKVCRAWGIKENLRHLWNYWHEGWMRRYFSKWYWWATHSRLEPIIRAARTLKKHLNNIVTYAKHRITNALGESLNAKIEKVKRLACGFRNRANYRTAIYFHCGGLDLLPVRSRVPLQIMAA